MAVTGLNWSRQRLDTCLHISIAVTRVRTCQNRVHTQLSQEKVSERRRQDPRNMNLDQAEKEG